MVRNVEVVQEGENASPDVNVVDQEQENLRP